MGYVTKGSCETTKAYKIKLVACLVLGVLFLSIAALTMIVDPVVIITKYSSRADYGTFLHEALSKETDSIHLSTYLFNITNAEQFLSGEDDKLKVQEVGPFTYQENRTNEDLQIDNVAGVIRYTPRHRVTFLPEESVGDPKEMIVTMPNIAMLAMASLTSNYGYLARFGFNMLTAKLRSNATVTMSAHEYLWGYDEPLIRLGNKFLPGWINFDRLGLLDRLYDKNASIRLEVSSRDHDKFMIKRINGIGGLKMWGSEDPGTRTYCNSFNDTYEGLSYPPQLKPDRPIRIYRNVLCRFLELDYLDTRVTEYGIKALHYKMSNRTYAKIPENQCLCNKGTCYEGVSDLSPCLYGLPLVLSNAHFMDTDPKIHEKIEGFNPNEEQHGSAFAIEPTIGSVMVTKFSVQVNVNVKNVDFSSKISRFSNMFVPVTYFKIVQPKLGDEQVSVLRMLQIYSYYLLLAIQITLIIAGLLLLSQSVRLLYFNWIYARKQVLNLCTKDASEVTKEPLMKR